jgi:hypothetical protein
MMHESPVPPMTCPFLSGGGKTGEYIRAFDWQGSSLGAPESWAPALQTLVSVILGSQQAMFVIWGPEHLMLYNDSCAQILGSKPYA